MESPEFADVDRIRGIVAPLGVKVQVRRRGSVYYLVYDTAQHQLLNPAFDSLFELVNPLTKFYYPLARITSCGLTRATYRLGSLFDFITRAAEKPVDK